MHNFPSFSIMIKKRFDQLAKGDLFVVDVDLDVLWNTYLNSFPPGTNEIFRERREYDCSCCRSFIKNIGNVVAINKEKLETIWDVVVPYPYDIVAAKLSELVRSAKIKTTFFARDAKMGVRTNLEHTTNGHTIEWNHFYCEVPAPIVKRDPGELRSKSKSDVQVIRRGLDELTLESAETVLELINENSLYRGEQYKKQIEVFIKGKKEYQKLSSNQKDLYVWSKYRDLNLRIRNTAIGTLLVDISAGKSVEDAVATFEAMVAPSNYRRSSAPVTKSMVTNAIKTLRELGLEDAIARRHATPNDVSIRDVLFVNRQTSPMMKDSLESLLMPEVKANKVSTNGMQEIGIEKFLSEVVPSSSKIEVMLENRHAGNLVSITAPANAGSMALFNWDNVFAWTYNGNVTDSIKQKVKAAGGDVTARCRVSLSWENTDDLDLYAYEPNGTLPIYYGHKRPRRTSSDGYLDVDMNVSNPVRGAVENIRWNKIPVGTTEIRVNNFHQRERTDPGFTVEFECDGDVHQFSYNNVVKNDETIIVFKFTFDGTKIVEVKPSIKVKEGSISKDLWGLKTNEYHEVSMMLLSPNFWGDSASGNKHYMFMIKDCLNPEPIRGFFNEYLRSELNQHRKVFELLADKTKCEVADTQLSGLGFSSTIHNNVVVKVTTNDGIRPYKVMF